MAEEVCISLRKQPPSEGDGNEAVAKLERLRLGDRQVFAFVVPDGIVSRLGLVQGDRFVLESTDESPLTVEFKYALDAIARHLKTTRQALIASHPVGLLNTLEGERYYWRVKRGVPQLPIARCKYGVVVQAGSAHFVYLNPDIWDSGRDVVPTSIHLLLHIFRPEDEEEQISVIEREIYGPLSLKPKGVLERDV